MTSLQHKKTLIHITLLCSAIIAVFGNSLRNGFVWDDEIFTIGNRIYKNFSLREIFFSLGNGVEYLPLRDLSFAIDYAVWGENAFGFHLTNLLLYVANITVVYFMTMKVVSAINNNGPSEAVSPASTSFAIALLFAIHPIHSEVVSFISCRNVLVSGLFFFLANLFYLLFLSNERKFHAGYYAGTMICLICALLSKATAIILPLTLLLLMLFIEMKEYRTRLVQLAPFFIISLIFYFLFKEFADKSGIIDKRLFDPLAQSVNAKLATTLQIPFFYLKKLILAYGYSAEYDVTFSVQTFSLTVITAFVALLAALAASFAARTKHPEFLFGISWFITTMIPALHFFPTIPVVADRYAFLPVYGACFCIAMLAKRFITTGYRPLILSCSAVIAISWSVSAFARNMEWHDNETLWKSAINTSPNSPKAHLNLGLEYFKQKKYDLAFDQFARCQELKISFDYYTYHKGVLAYEQGDYRKAISLFNKSLSMYEDFTFALYGLGLAHEKNGNIVEAIRCYNRVLALHEADIWGPSEDARVRLKQLMGSLPPQLDELRKIVSLSPNDLEARGTLALKLDELGLYDEALKHYLELAAMDGNKWQIYHNMGNICQKLRRFDEAVSHYEKSLALNPSIADTLNNLGIVYMQLRRFNQAIAAFNKAMHADIDLAFAPVNLAKTYYKMGDIENARRYFEFTSKRFPELQEHITPYLRTMEKSKSGKPLTTKSLI